MPAQRRIIVIWLPRLQSDLALRRLGLDAPFAVVDRQRGAETAGLPERPGRRLGAGARHGGWPMRGHSAPTC